MKKLLTLLFALAIPTLTFAAPFTFFQGGTGTTTPGLGLIYSTSTNTLGAFQAYAPSNYGCLLQASSTSPFGFFCVATSTLGFTGGAGTVTSVAATVPTGLSVAGSPITTSGTLAFTLTPGFVIPLTASTTQWANAYASTTALNGISPIVYTPATGAFSCPTCNTSASNVISVFGRTGAVTAQSGDYATFYPSFAYGTSTYVNYPYASTTFSTYGYGSSTYYFASNPSGYISSAYASSTFSTTTPWIIGLGTLYNATSTDNVGIGTTTPNKILHVYGNQSGGIMKVERFNAVTTGILGTQAIKGKSTGDMTDGFGVAQTFVIEDNAGVENIVGDIFGERNGADNTGALGLRAYTAGNTSLLSGAILYIDGNNQTMEFGTSSAAATLNITGTSSKPNLDIFVAASSSGPVPFIVKNTGRVGLGTNTPSFTLDVLGSGRFNAATTSSSTGTMILNRSSASTQSEMVQFANGLTSDGYIGRFPNSDDIVMGYDFGSGFQEKMRLTSAGNLGIGTTTPQGLLHIASAAPKFVIQENDATADNQKWDILANNEQLNFRVGNNADSVANAWLTVTRSTTAPGTIVFPAGNVGVGTSSPPAKLYVQGVNGSGSDLFSVATSTSSVGATSTLFRIQANGHIQFGASSTASTLQPTIVCGSGATLVGSDMNGRITCGTGVTTTFTLTFASTWTVPPSCFINPEYAAGAVFSVPAATTLAITVGNSAASQKIDYFCVPR